MKTNRKHRAKKRREQATNNPAPKPVTVIVVIDRNLSGPLTLLDGWRLASDPSPGPEYRVGGVRNFRTAPEGENVKLYKWLLTEKTRRELAVRAAEKLQAVRLEDIQASGLLENIGHRVTRCLPKKKRK